MSQPFDPTAEAGAPHLQRALGQLPAHEPDLATWPRIAAQLDADAALAHVIPTLPAHEPDDALWLAIAARLDAVPQQPAGTDAAAFSSEAAPLAPPAPGRTLKLPWRARATRRSLSLAASVLLVLGLWWQLRPVRSGATEGLHETVAYSEETTTETSSPAVLPTALALDPLEQQGLAFIDAHCTSQPAVCGSGEFRVLRSQLAELEAEQARLTEDARRFGESPELRREQTRLITLRARLTRELVQLIIT